MQINNNNFKDLDTLFRKLERFEEELLKEDDLEEKFKIKTQIEQLKKRISSYQM